MSKAGHIGLFSLVPISMDMLKNEWRRVDIY